MQAPARGTPLTEGPVGREASERAPDALGNESAGGRLRYGLIAAAVVVADQILKQVVVTTLEHGDSIEVLGGVLNFSHVRNSGAAFGLLRGFGGFLALAALVGVVVFVGIIVRRPPFWVGVGAGLVAGGALGNLLDRIFRPWPLQGTVVDYVDFRFWPAFNLADTAITIGAAILLVTGMRSGPAGDTGGDEHSAAGDR